MAEARSPAYVNFLKSIETVDKSTFSDDNERYAALDAARELCMRLETSADYMVHHNVVVPATQMAIRTVFNMGIIRKLAEDEGSQWTTSQLAEFTGADPALLSRLLKHLGANRLITETDVNTWSANQFTRDFNKREVSSGMDFLYDMVWPSYSKAPEYLAQNGYKNPTSATDGVWQYATDSVGTPVFTYLGARPQMDKNFMEFMSGFTFRKQKWTDIYPARELFSRDEGGALVVDVGGGIGSDLAIFLKEHPQGSGRVVLQDQPAVVNQSQSKEGIQVMAHDFFTPQPVKGARAYLLHAVFHDWSDEKCGEILEQLKCAMSPGYSKVLVVDCVVPAKGAHPETTSLDISMMNFTGAWERTEEQWAAMFKAAGFKIVKIHRGRLESVIEADQQ